MKEFKLEIDTQATPIKIIRFMGTLLLGLSLGWTSFELKHSMPVDWMAAISTALCAIVFAFFPGKGVKAHLLINEEGIFSFPIKLDLGFRDSKISWDKIESLGLKKNHIRVKELSGPYRKIKLPLYTKEQWLELREYLKEAAAEKEVSFQNS